MKRDWDVMRLILTTLEAHPDARFQVFPQDFAPVDPATAAYHLHLLKAGGFIEGYDRSQPGVEPGKCFIAQALTLAGHDLADTLKSRTVWSKVCELARQKGIELTFDTVKELAAHAVRGLL